MSTTGGEFWTQAFAKPDGTPYQFCRVFHYEAGVGSTIDRNVYVNESLTELAQQPRAGDTSGRVWFYGDGSYRLLVKSSLDDGDLVLYDWTNVKLTAKAATLRDENQGTSYPAALPLNRGQLFARKDISGNIIELGLQKDTQFYALQFESAPTSGTVSWSKGADLAAASTLTLGSDGNLFDVTGTTLISAITAKPSGTYLALRLLNGAPLQHNATSLILMDGANAITNSGDMFWFVSLGSGNWAEVSRRQASTGSPHQVGLVGVSTVSALQVSAIAVTMRTSGNQAVTRYNIGTTTCDITLAGPIINGRDQPTSFGSSVWVHFYWIWNGSVTGLLASLAPPPTGPTLPTGFTHWGYVTAIFLNASSQLLAVRVAGSEVFYHQFQNVLAGGTQTSETPIALTQKVPPNALAIMGETLATVTSGGGGSATSELDLRVVSANTAHLTRAQAQVASSTGSVHNMFRLPNVNQQISYLFAGDSGSVGARLASIWITGYKMPNGGE